MHVKALDHIHIYSLHLDRSVEFWQRHFAAEKVLETENNLDQAVVILRVGGSPSPKGRVSAAGARG